VSAGHQAGLGDDRADGELGDRGGVAPGRVDDEDALLARGGEIDVHRPAARDGDQLERRHPLEHRGGERRELGNRDLGQVDKVDDRLGVALVFLEAVHSRLGVAVPHRLVGPRQFYGFDIEERVAAGPDRRLERRGRHEPIADDGDFRPPSSLSAHVPPSRHRPNGARSAGSY
jgi:hypothetical protein